MSIHNFDPLFYDAIRCHVCNEERRHPNHGYPAGKDTVDIVPTAAWWEAEVKRLRSQRDELRVVLRNVIAPPPNTEWADQAIEAQRLLARIDAGGEPCDTPCGLPSDPVPCNVGPKGHPGHCNHFGPRDAKWEAK